MHSTLKALLCHFHSRILQSLKQFFLLSYVLLVLRLFFREFRIESFSQSVSHSFVPQTQTVCVCICIYLFIYRTCHIVLWRFTILLLGKIGRQLARAPLVAPISPCIFDLPPIVSKHTPCWIELFSAISPDIGSHCVRRNGSYSYQSSH